MSELAAKSCVPRMGGVPPLEGPELERLQAQLGGDWQVVDGHHLEKEFTFPDFRQALGFTNWARAPGRRGTTPTSASPGARWAYRSGRTPSTGLPRATSSWPRR